MLQRIGVSKVGLASTEAPAVIKPAQSFNHVGLWRLGTPQKLLEHTMFRCKGRIMVDFGNHMTVRGSMTLAKHAFHRVAGTVFSPMSKFAMLVTGSIVLPKTVLCKVNGNIRQSMSTIYTAVGTMGQGWSMVHSVTAICKANSHSIMKATGVLQQQGRNFARATGTLLANAGFAMTVRGIIQRSYNATMKCQGVLGYGYSSAMRAIGTLQQSSTSLCRVLGGLANTKGHNFLRVVAKVNIAAFVAEVPKRTQEFFTNKRWFS